MKNYGIHFFLASMMTVLAFGTLANAIEQPPDWEFTFAQGTVCNFALLVEGWDGKEQTTKEFTDKNGIVRSISAGVGSALRFTNVETGQTFSSKSNGSVRKTTYNIDGSTTFNSLGNTVWFFFPTDNPPGPSTTLYIGQVVVINDADANSTLLEENGKKIDICAEVSQ